MTNKPLHVAVIGTSGAIGNAFARAYAAHSELARLYTFSRYEHRPLSDKCIHNTLVIDQEKSIEHAANSIEEPLDVVVVTIGQLHNNYITPEKSLREVDAESLAEIYRINTIIPVLLAKYFVPKLHRHKRSLFVVLSARVGSISDNRLGGWYAYRASKAALNMLIKNIAIEVKRRTEHAVIAGLHPGTVASELSKPFQSNVKQLFTPDESVAYMLDVMSTLTPEDSGQCFAWDGQRIGE